MRRFGVALGELVLLPSASEIAARRVGLRAHGFRFLACAASEIALGGLAFGLTASAFRHVPIRGCRWASWFFRLPFRSLPTAGWPSGSRLPLFGTHRFGVAVRRVGLRVHRFRFSACTASEIALGGLAFGLTASAFRHAPLRKLPSAGWFFRWAGWPSGSLLPLFGMRRFGVAAGRVRSSAGRFGLRAHRFRFSACAASELPRGEFVLPLGGLAFGLTASAFRRAPLRSCPRRVGSAAFRFGVALAGLTFGLTASAFRHAPIRSGRWASSFFRLPFRRLPLGELAFGLTASAFRHAPLRKLPSAGWPSGSLLPLFGMHRFAPPHCRSEDRRSTTTRQLFHFKTLISTC